MSPREGGGDRGARGPLLYCRSRRLAVSVLLLAAVAVTAFVLNDSLVKVGYSSDQNTPVTLILLPAVSAVILSATAHGSMQPWDGLGGPVIRRARLTHTALASLGAALTAWALLPTDILDDRGGAAVARNVVALCGLALLAVRVIGHALAWCVPLLLAAVTLTLGIEPQVSWLWSWLLAANADIGAAVTAAALWLTSMVVFARHGERRSADL
ncbi:hypothetical protein IM697_02600 [Streptomyces ferrugineus]|uniref:Uncharacterized protein n=1 Tax=Streptomyces ferrugineus TaxID=1413221 RepID=A0A7M2SLX4_9ACTN|nr:hypothetical protein [Streptomyces ferrugineus]QOV37356.1 hypothetical protein IM697_02600 [Streptomyces ferrugineus]